MMDGVERKGYEEPVGHEEHEEHVEHEDQKERGLNILFIGFMGSGKSVVAHGIGEMFSKRVIDLDRVIARRSGMTIPQIFSSEGEKGFRKREADALASMVSQQPCIISCGGGIVTHEGNIPLLRSLGTVVYLQVTAREAARRIAHPETRPMLAGTVPPSEILKGRIPLYEQAADITIDTVGKTSAQVCAEVGEILWKKGLI